jgi:transcriptional regulator with XRE-family HTH domain
VAIRKRKSSARRLFAENLRRRRRELKISQEKLAELCDLHRTYISSIERAERSVGIDNMETIAESLKCDLSELLKAQGDVKKAGK